MLRKHYKAIAEAIRENIQSKELREELARAILPALRDSNPRFDSCRFLTAAVA